MVSLACVMIHILNSRLGIGTFVLAISAISAVVPAALFSAVIGTTIMSSYTTVFLMFLVVTWHEWNTLQATKMT